MAPIEPAIAPGLYRHCSGKQYEVIGLAHHTETKEPVVLYRALYDCPDLAGVYGIRPMFVRPFDMFIGLVEVDGKHVPRFQRVD